MEKLKVITRGHTDRTAKASDAEARDTVADACGDAAVAFMTKGAIGWDKLDLVLWLTGPYTRATRTSDELAKMNDDSGPASSPPESEEPISEETVGALVQRVQLELRSCFGATASASVRGTIVADAVGRGLVRKAFQVDMWVPVRRPRMRLRDRVCSLFVAEHLNSASSDARSSQRSS